MENHFHINLLSHLLLYFSFTLEYLLLFYYFRILKGIRAIELIALQIAFVN